MVRFAAVIAMAGSLALSGQSPGERLRSGVRIGAGPWLEMWTVGPGGDLPQAISNSLIPVQEGSFYRVFFDRSQKLVFAYELQVAGLEDGQGYRIHVKPVDDSFRRRYREALWLRGWSDDQPLPTFAKSFDPRPVRIGDQLSIRLLHDTATDRTVSDILRLASPKQSSNTLPPATSGELRLSNLKVSVDGEPLGQQPSGGVTGPYVMFYLPGHGAFFFSRTLPEGYPQFQGVGRADGAAITFSWQGRRYECVSDGPVTSDPGPMDLWVFVEPSFRRPGSGAGADAAYLSAAGSLRSLLSATR